MLSKMRYGNMEYDDAKRKEYQSKMRALRENGRNEEKDSSIQKMKTGSANKL